MCNSEKIHKKQIIKTYLTFDADYTYETLSVLKHMKYIPTLFIYLSHLKIVPNITKVDS